MKKITIFCLVLFLFTNLLFSQYTVTQRTPWEWIKEELFYNNMIANTVKTIETLEKNYKKSEEFFNKAVYYYEKIQKVQENPYGLLRDEEIKKFLSKYESTRKLLNTYDETNKIYSQVKTDIDNIVKEYETFKNKVYSDIEKAKNIVQNNINYLQKNWKFMTEVTKNMKEQTSSVVESLKQLESFKNIKDEEKKVKIEELKTKLALSQLQAQQETNMLILKLIEIQNQQMEQLLLTQKEIVDRQNMFYQSIKIKKSKE